MPSFRKSIGYIRMLAELDLLKDTSRSDDEELRLFEEQSVCESSTVWTDVEGKAKNQSGGYVNMYEPANEESTCYKLTASISQKGDNGIKSYDWNQLKRFPPRSCERWHNISCRLCSYCCQDSRR